MTVANNARERRRRRIEELTKQLSVLDPAPEESGVRSPNTVVSVPPKPQETESGRMPAYRGPAATDDPELWWKERAKRLHADAPGWQGLQPLPAASRPREDWPPRQGGFMALLRGFGLRLAVAALLFGATWGWTRLELPGSGQGRDWLVTAVTRDMNFKAIEAWYDDNFAGSPSLFSFSRDDSAIREVSAVLRPEQIAPPVRGRMLESFAVSGTGVKIAAAAGSGVAAVYTGRVVQIETEGTEGITVLVEHANRILTVYGRLAIADVRLNEWVETGRKLGELPASDQAGGEAVLYFAIQQNGKSLDPAEVVTFD